MFRSTRRHFKPEPFWRDLADGLEIAATCKVVELDRFTDEAPPD
jgi:hypothetical protein